MSYHNNKMRIPGLGTMEDLLRELVEKEAAEAERRRQEDGNGLREFFPYGSTQYYERRIAKFYADEKLREEAEKTAKAKGKPAKAKKAATKTAPNVLPVAKVPSTPRNNQRGFIVASTPLDNGGLPSNLPLFNDLPSIASEDSPAHDVYTMATLRNNGNTCYMNAALYSLRFLPGFMHRFHHLVQNFSGIFGNGHNDGGGNLSVDCDQELATIQLLQNLGSSMDLDMGSFAQDEERMKIVEQLHKVFSALTQLETNEDQHALEIRALQNVVFHGRNAFREGEQADSHEFLMLVLNCIRDHNEKFNDLLELYVGLKEGIDPASLNVSFFQDVFMGKRKTTITCATCNTAFRPRDEDMVDLLVPLAEDMQLNDKFIEEISTGETDIYRVLCARCDGDHVKSVTTFQQLPRLLIVQLGRFRNIHRKATTNTPLPFKMDCFCDECIENTRNGVHRIHEYHLTSVIIHLGYNLAAGHYVAYVRRFNENQTRFRCPSNECCQPKVEASLDTWYECNDDQITTISQEELVGHIDSGSAPYVLFFARNDLLNAQN